MSSRSEAFEKRRRAVTMAGTYLRKAERLLGLEGLPPDPSYCDLFETALDVALEVMKSLPGDYFDDVEATDFFNLGITTVNLSDTANETIEKLAALITERRGDAKHERRIRALENVVGRTPEEAAAYLAKARSLRDSR